MKDRYNRIFAHENQLYLTLIVFGTIFFTIDFCNHYFFRTSAFDYGVYNFALYDYAHLRISDCPVYLVSHVNFMQDHLSFTMFLFVPIFWILGWFTGTYTLLFVQTAIILYGGWAVYKLVALKTTEKYFPLLALLQYFVLFGRWPAFVSDCNLAIIAASAVPVFLYYFEKKKFGLAGVAFAFVLLTREDMALWTAFIGIFLLITHYKDKILRRASISIIIISVLYFVLVFKVFIPFFETPDKKYNLFNYSALGANPAEAIVFIIKHPLKALEMLFVNQGSNPSDNKVKFEFYYVYLLSGGFLLLFRPRYILLFIPLLAKKMLNDDSVRWSNELYYSIEFVSVLPIAVFLILSELKNKTLQYWLTCFVCISTLAITIAKLNGYDRKLNWWGDSKYAFYKTSMYKTGFDERKVYKSLALIPPDARISASTTILPHLAFREKIYYFPRVEDAEYIAIFKRDIWPLNRESFDNELKKYHTNNNWKVIMDEQGLVIIQRIN